MKRFLLPLCSMLALSVTFTACKKDDDDPKPQAAKTKTELLTAKNWRMTAYTADPAYDLKGNGVRVTDLYAQLGPTDQDDFERFEKPSAYTYDEGATKADENPQTVSGTWAFTTGETGLSVTLPGRPANTSELVELTETTLKVKQVHREDGINYIFTRTYAKQ